MSILKVYIRFLNDEGIDCQNKYAKLVSINIDCQMEESNTKETVHYHCSMFKKECDKRVYYNVFYINHNSFLMNQIMLFKKRISKRNELNSSNNIYLSNGS